MSASSSPSHDSSSSGSKPDEPLPDATPATAQRAAQPAEEACRLRLGILLRLLVAEQLSPRSHPGILLRAYGMCDSLLLVRAQLRRLVIVAGAALLFAVPSGSSRLAALRRRRPRHEPRVCCRGGGAVLGDRRRHRHALERERRRAVRRVARYTPRTCRSARRREDAIFVATNAGTVAALRAVDGSVLWKRQVSAATRIPACGITYGISSTPVLDRARGRLYTIGSDGLLHALSLATGERCRRLAAAHRRAHRRRVRLGRPDAAREPPLCTRRELLRQARPGRLHRRRPARGRRRRRPSHRRLARCHRRAEQHGRASGATPG